MTLPIRIFTIAALAICMFATPILGDPTVDDSKELSAAGKNILEQGEGAVADAVFFQIASQLSHDDFVAALYNGSRAQRRIALDSVGYLENPWPVFPYLVSFLEASERQTASIAAASLRSGLVGAVDARRSPQLPIGKQAAQSISMLQRVAKNEAISTDLRVVAVQLMGIIRESKGSKVAGLASLFTLESLAVRQAALNLVTFPMDDATLSTVAQLATHDVDPVIKGVAVSMVCENALSHNISKPSKDLVELVAGLMDSSSEESVISPVLGCLVHFPYQSRATLTDKIMNCGNEKVIKYWKSLTQ